MLTQASIVRLWIEPDHLAAGQESAAVEAETELSEGGQGAAPETVLLTETEAGLMTETDTDAGECRT